MSIYGLKSRESRGRRYAVNIHTSTHTVEHQLSSMWKPPKVAAQLIKKEKGMEAIKVDMIVPWSSLPSAHEIIIRQLQPTHILYVFIYRLIYIHIYIWTYNPNIFTYTAGMQTQYTTCMPTRNVRYHIDRRNVNTAEESRRLLCLPDRF